MRLEFLVISLLLPLVARADPPEKFQFTPDMLKMRDPFRKPILAAPIEETKPDLESYAADSFELIGVMTGPSHLRAMVRAPNGKTFFVDQRTKMGIHGGMIKKITPEAVVVREKVVDVLGQEEVVDIDIKMPPETKRNLTTETMEGAGRGGGRNRQGRQGRQGGQVNAQENGFGNGQGNAQGTGQGFGQ